MQLITKFTLAILVGTLCIGGGHRPSLSLYLCSQRHVLPLQAELPCALLPEDPPPVGELPLVPLQHGDPLGPGAVQVLLGLPLGTVHELLLIGRWKSACVPFCEWQKKKTTPTFISGMGTLARQTQPGSPGLSGLSVDRPGGEGRGGRGGGRVETAL